MSTLPDAFGACGVGVTAPLSSITLRWSLEVSAGWRICDGDEKLRPRSGKTRCAGLRAEEEEMEGYGRTLSSGDDTGSDGGVPVAGDDLPASPLPPSSLASRDVGGLKYPPWLNARKGCEVAFEEVGENGRKSSPLVGDAEPELGGEEEGDAAATRREVVLRRRTFSSLGVSSSSSSGSLGISPISSSCCSPCCCCPSLRSVSLLATAGGGDRRRGGEATRGGELTRGGVGGKPTSLILTVPGGVVGGVTSHFVASCFFFSCMSRASFSSVGEESGLT